MTKPIGFYTSAMPGDGSILDDLQSTYGSTFERLGRTEKFLILDVVVHNLLYSQASNQEPLITAEAMSLVTSFAPDIRQLSISEQLGFAEALINQLKYQN